MPLGLGSDIVEVKRIEDVLKRHGKRFADRIFTQEEQEYCNRFRDAARHYAGRFAAKEAISKALGTGISSQLHWLDMQIRNDAQGKPYVEFTSSAKDHFNNPHLEITISHSREYALAVAIKAG